MKTILRAVFCTSAIAAALAFSASNAKAQTATVPFSGTVAETCAFSNIIAGTLALSGDGTDLENATNGTVDVDCNGDFTMTVAAPAFTTSTGGTDITALTNYAATSTLTDSTTTLTTNNGGAGFAFGTANAVTATDTFVVTMNAATDVQIPADTYNFDVVITATP